MLSPLNSPSKPYHPLPSPRPPLTFNLQLRCSEDDSSSNDDFRSMKTADTFHQPEPHSALDQRRSIEDYERQQRSLRNLCRSIKQKEAVIRKLNLEVEILSEENRMLRGQGMEGQKSVRVGEGMKLEDVDGEARIRYFELIIRQKDQEIREVAEKHQQQINLFYSNSSARLKAKEIECYNNSKMLKEERMRSQELEDRCNSLKAENENLKLSVNYLFKEKEKLAQEKDRVCQELRKAEVAILRLNYCQTQLKYLNEEYFKERGNVSKATDSITTLREENSRLSRQLQQIKVEKPEVYLLNERIIGLEEEMSQLKSKFRVREEGLKLRAKNCQKLLEEQSNQVFSKELGRVNQLFKGRIF